MKVIVNGIEKNLVLKAWDESGHQWGCDIFAEIDTSVREGQELTEEEYADLVDFWTKAVESYNEGDYEECLGDPEENIDKEFGFWAD